MLSNMATPASDGRPLQRSQSYELLPPDMSELRLVLLGSNWSQRNSVGNFILGVDGFKNEAQSCMRISGEVENMKISVINTPDLQFPTADSLTEFIRHCAAASAPGPHVFLLVLQPENFTEEEKNKIYKVLKAFSDRSFDHSFVMILKPGLMSWRPLQGPRNKAPIKELIRKCRYRHIKMGETDLPELLTRFGQIVKENNGEHVRYEEFEEARSSLEGFHQNQGGKTATGSDDSSAGPIDFWPCTDSAHLPLPVSDQRERSGSRHQVMIGSGFRIMMLGKNEEKKTKLGNLIIGEEQFHQQKFNPTKHSETFSGEWRGKPVTVVKTPDMFSLTVESFIEEMQSCMSLCPPGPNILLLVLKPSDFSEKNRETLKFILSLFGQDAFRYSMIVFTHDSEIDSPVNDLIRLVQGRCYNMNTNDCSLLMTQIETIIEENRGTYLTFRDETSRSQQEQMKPLNLVLFGPSDPLKTAAAKAILGQDLPSASNSSECVRKQGEAFGRRVSLVELPALGGKAQQEVMEESFRCVSLCDPEGVQAFILVLPVGPLTDEDKGELHTIQDTFSSRVNDFTIILFTTDSDPEHPAVINFVKENKDIQDLIQICGGRYLALNIRDRRQIEELMETVEKSICIKENPRCFTAKTLACGQREMISSLQAELKDLKTKIKVTDGDQKQSSETLRIVMIGKTGSGKSSSGNTILQKKTFKAELSQVSVTKICQKAKSEVDGRPIDVVDTPGLFDSSLTSDEINDELVKCMSLLAPGPHVFLLVLSLGRLTPEEKDTLESIKKVFGKDSENFTIILFTRGDDLAEEDMSIEQYIEKKCNDSFKKLISDCGGRYHVFNNRKKEDRSQVSELIRKIDTMVMENKGNFYTNEMLQEAEAAIKKEMKRILKEKEEEMERMKEEMERKHEEEKEEIKRRMEEQRSIMEKERKQKAEQLKEMEERISKEQEERKKEQEEKEEEVRKRRQEEEQQQQKWDQERIALEIKINSESQEKETIDRKLEEMRKEMKEKRETWEKERKESWEKQQKDDEERRAVEQQKLKKLQKEFAEEREEYEKKIRENERKIRDEEEKQRKELEENYKKKIQEMKSRYEEEARKQAEDFNEFKEKYKKELFALMEKHDEEIKEVKKKHKNEMQDKEESYTKEYKLLHDLSTQKEKDLKHDLTRKEKQLKDKAKENEQLDELKKKQEKELNDLKNKFVVKYCTLM